MRLVRDFMYGDDGLLRVRGFVAVTFVGFLASAAILVAVPALALFLVARWPDSEGESSLQLAAELLCPNAPEDVKGDLFFYKESDVPRIGVRDTEEWVGFSFAREDRASDQLVLYPRSPAARDYLESMPDSCFDGSWTNASASAGP